MSGVVFFIVVLFVGIVLLGFGGLAGLRARHLRQDLHWDGAERTGMRFMLEFSLFTMFFSVLPLALMLLNVDETVVWRVASLLLALFLFTVVGRVLYKIVLYNPRWPILIISLLVLSVILLTIELINVFWWSSLAVYSWGLLWVLILSCIQFIIFVTYDWPNSDAIIHTLPGVDVGRHGMQRNHPNRYSDGQAHHHTNIHRDPIHYARRQRYAKYHPFARTTRTNRRPFTDTTLGAN